MKILKYSLSTRINYGTKENPVWEEVLSPVSMELNEGNEEIAKREAYKGEYTIDDDGIEETTESTPEERIKELEEALDMLLNGVTE